LVALLVTGLAIACSESGRSKAPALPAAPFPTPSPASALTVSGRPFEHTAAGIRPLAGLPLTMPLWRQRLELKVTTSDSGHYEVSGVTADALTIAPAGEAEYRAPCRPGTDFLRSDGAFDVHVVSTGLLSTAVSPASAPLTGIRTGGLVFPRTPDGTRPVGGADVTLDYDGVVMSSTVSDANGRFLLCTSRPASVPIRSLCCRFARRAIER
jgi:hypothetical protein